MPASRSRTEQWRSCIEKVLERNGGIELTIDRSGIDPDRAPCNLHGPDLVWRVRLLQIRPGSLLVESPAAFGASLELEPGLRLVGAMTIGQNRWMFHTCVRGREPGSNGGLILALPERVERCSRRTFYRISTAELKLPTVQCWPLLDPTSVAAAQAANRLQIRQLHGEDTGIPATEAVIEDTCPESPLLPDVGPMFGAELLNLSGGGLGLRIQRSDMGALDSRPHTWLRLDLRPEIPVPIGVTARVAHKHIDSTQAVYAGLAFDFSHDQEHRRFVLDLITAHVRQMMIEQLRGSRAA